MSSNLYPGTSVLLIDADASSSAHVAHQLKMCSAGYRVVPATDGRTGRELYNAQRFDCVVVELDLPDMSGFQILMDLVRNVSRPEVAVIILTRLTNPMLAKLALEQGAQACLRKSLVSGDQLHEAIQTALTVIGPTPTTQRKNNWAREAVFQMF